MDPIRILLKRIFRGTTPDDGTGDSEYKEAGILNDNLGVIEDHLNNQNNPHGVSPAQIGTLSALEIGEAIQAGLTAHDTVVSGMIADQVGEVYEPLTASLIVTQNGAQTLSLSAPASTQYGLWLNGLRQPRPSYSVSGSTVSIPADMGLIAGDRVDFETMVPRSAAAQGSYTSDVLLFSNRVSDETPAGAQDGVNAVFSLAATPRSGTLILTYNGTLLVMGADADYTLSGSMITLGFVPPGSARLRASYFRTT